MGNAKQSIRRTVAGLLAGAMLLGMTPLAAFAEGSSSASGDWQFKAFGTSTAAGVNTIADGADINGKVTLNSCTIKDDGTIDKKGGKFVADSPADGLSFYYRKLFVKAAIAADQIPFMGDFDNGSPHGILLYRGDNAIGHRPHRRPQLRLDVNAVMGVPFVQRFIFDQLRTGKKVKDRIVNGKHKGRDAVVWRNGILRGFLGGCGRCCGGPGRNFGR